MRVGQFLRHVVARWWSGERHIRSKYRHFKELLAADSAALDIIADLEAHLYGHDPADFFRIRWLVNALRIEVERMVEALGRMNPADHEELRVAFSAVTGHIDRFFEQSVLSDAPPYILDLRVAGDSPGQVGGKAANLSLARQAGVPVPPGFVITATAFTHFLRENGLESKFDHLFRVARLSKPDAITHLAGELQELVLSGEVPSVLRDALFSAVETFVPPKALLAVRSSALAEDGEVSFAGQYASELHVDRRDICNAYKRVLAGKYCPRAISYRIGHGLSDMDTAMAVLILPMVDAVQAGVVYTCDPACSAVGGDALGVYVVNGLASELVDGSSTPGKYYLTREDVPRILPGCACEGVVRLAECVVLELGRWCMLLEKAFGFSQDVEWALDSEGLKILQTRPLFLQKSAVAVQQHNIRHDEPALYSGLACASPGVACGPVFHAMTGTDFRNIPPGSVVVTPTLRPALSQFLDRIAAVVAEHGSRASHFASVARERGVPVIVGCDLRHHASGSLLTVDAVTGTIFSGCVRHVVESGTASRRQYTDVRSRWSTLSGHTVHLGLTDTSVPGFCAAGCRSLHDVVRYCHERGVAEMFTLVDRNGRGLGRSRKLKTDLPLVMYVLDLGGGLCAAAGERGEILPSAVVSAPMEALWDGLTDHRIVWDQRRRHVDWEEFDRISGGIFSLNSRLLASYAVISSNYMHLNIRFGYHFSLLDSVCGPRTGENYVSFRFKGGGASVEQRRYRLVFIEKVLHRLEFEVAMHGDMLDASVQRLPKETVQHALRTLGVVLAATRLMDLRLHSTEDARQEAEMFLREFFSREPL